MNRIKSKYVCKNSMSEFPRYGTGGWTTIFIEGKEYDCEYEPWNFETGHRLNGAFRRYWVTGEDGEQREMNRTRFKAVFHTEHEMKSQKRDLLLEGILGESPKKQRKEE